MEALTINSEEWFDVIFKALRDTEVSIKKNCLNIIERVIINTDKESEEFESLKDAIEKNKGFMYMMSMP
jgi:hypothetical protein